MCYKNSIIILLLHITIYLHHKEHIYFLIKNTLFIIKYCRCTLYVFKIFWERIITCISRMFRCFHIYRSKETKFLRLWCSYIITNLYDNCKLLSTVKLQKPENVIQELGRIVIINANTCSTGIAVVSQFNVQWKKKEEELVMIKKMISTWRAAYNMSSL